LRISLQRSPAAPFRPKAASFRTIPLRRFSDPGTHAVDRLVLAVFSASRLLLLSISLLEDAARAGHS
jgi:hypothetical protein